ncbi:hypothetical protein BABINDRAFT_159079 [Babjeviella inositovora NRRL Y-12698]|uniref:DNA-directed RNA polymerase subunit n=1 Tax=Babjeviella inositovora NRRL Y-12698 TaxID=984486 RepID=A0A1E3QXV7_9ASCO|nr:uncharacterized protein BABINDRAFT_159079 [Babjeviella inositovora NRRL Y-12698]ODQ82503.1 hypothetical protein BABINDRAFT_159079 [Babjeviella inositovora NRRL Y-12698]
MSIETKRAYGAEETDAKRRKQGARAKNPVDDNGISECFQKVTTSLYVSLAPCHAANPIQGIKTLHLEPLVMTYFQPAHGVVLSYGNLKLSNDNILEEDGKKQLLTKISYDGPFSFLWISVDFLVWTPQVGDTLEGYSYMQSASHIGLLIHDTFNASIKKSSIPSGWEFVHNQVDEYATEVEENKFRSLGYWVDENGIKIEGRMKLTVKAVHSTGRVISVEGTLLQPNSERDALPIVPNKSKKFEDETPITVVAEEAKEEEDESVPTYTKESSDSEDEDGKVVAADSSDDDSD